MNYLYKCVKCKKVMPIDSKDTRDKVDGSIAQHCPLCHMPLIRLYTDPIEYPKGEVK